jgi:hypothetical protein
VNKEGAEGGIDFMNDIAIPALMGHTIAPGSHGAEAGVAVKAAEKLSKSTFWRTASVRTKAAAGRVLESGAPMDTAIRVLSGTTAVPAMKR